jgi:surface polysaccharide O-acyltransferase-like enzyme
MDPKGGDTSLPVNLIRTVAIVLVILLHASTEPDPAITNFMSPQGVQLWWSSNVFDSLARTCVPLFVMTTGALLLLPSKADEPLRVFFKKRWKRIGLPFIFWGAAYFAWSYFVNGQALTLNSILNGILTGPYYQFWFLYLLIGLYFLTPVLRIVIKHSERRTLEYLLALWFVGTAIIPLLTLFESYSLNANVFILTGWVGYFILGAYLIKVNVKRSILYLGFIAGSLWTIIGTYIVVGTIGERLSQYFYDASSFNIIIASATLFLLLASIPTQSLEAKLPQSSRLVRLIGENTLPIYLFHPMVLETLQSGYLGLKMSVTNMYPVVEMPLVTVVTLLVCLAIIVPLKKIPHVGRIIG